MNIAKLVVGAIGDGTKNGLIHAVHVGFAGWMFCGHHCGTIWDWKCFMNGIDCGVAAFHGKI